jgi:DNA-binding response OmpR family regulator
MTQQPLVDDEVAIQRAVGPLLRARGYDVEIAGTGAEPLSMVARQTPDLIVLDLGLPDLEGTEVCPGVRAASNVPIVMLSARGAEADKMNALDLGADDYVTKPFGPEELLARLRVALRRVPPEAGGCQRSVPGGRSHARLRSLPRPSQRDGDPVDAEGIRAPVAAGPQSRPRADPAPSSRLSGARTPSSSRSTCGRSSPSFARRSSRTRAIHGTC